MSGVKNEFGELVLQGCDLDGNLTAGIHRYATYTCGHCTTVVVMRSGRQRPRLKCVGCAKWLCEQNELCHTQCTPLHEMAKDRFENAGRYGTLVPAIMQGVTSVEDGVERGLILPDELN
jgi:hypothetical protein